VLAEQGGPDFTLGVSEGAGQVDGEEMWESEFNFDGT
jgi:hypothetical protein